MREDEIVYTASLYVPVDNLDPWNTSPYEVADVVHPIA